MGTTEELKLLEELLREAFAGNLAEAAEDVGLRLDRLLVLLGKDASSVLEGAGASRQVLSRAQAAVEDARRRSRRPRDLDDLRGLLVERLTEVSATAVGALGLVLGVIGLLISVAFPQAPLILVGSVIAAISLVGRQVALKGRRDVALAEERLQAARATYRMELRQAGVLPWLREQINAARAVDFRTRLTFRDVSGLAEVDDPNHEVPTAARERLRRIVTRMPGGAIGISGPRGVGKSTLMGSICSAEAASGDDGVLAVLVDAPVNYEARDFVLHLFAQVCSAVLGPDGIARLRGAQRSWPPFLTARNGYSSGAMLGIALIFLGLVVAVPELFGTATAKETRLIAAAALVIGGYWFFGVSSIQRLRARRPLSPSTWGSHDQLMAAIHLRRIWFQQTFSSGWSGGLKLPFGEGALSGSSELTEQRQSFPEIVADFRQFLVQVSAERQVRVGIDELDKMEDSEATAFLNGIKMIFRISGCFFFVSVSEDAMSAFERRGLPFRDVFDSSFDDVFYLEPLRFKDSRLLLNRRIVGLPLAFSALVHCVSGGLPRDVIRTARDLTELLEKPALSVVATELVGAALMAKLAATRIAARPLRSEDGLSLFTDWLEQLRRAGSSPATLLTYCTSFEVFLFSLYRLEFDSDLADERREIRRLATQILTYSYFAATVIEFFSALEEPAQIDEAISDRSPGQASSVDQLAAACQSFSSDLATTWAAISDFREGHSLTRVSFPHYPFASSAGTP